MKYEPVKDLAERKRILALIERCENEQIMNKQHMATYINALENRIRELEADRPQGKWIRERWTDKYLVGVECSNYHIVESRFSPFCPNCGAKMKGIDDE